MFLDGDKSSNKTEQIRHFTRALENHIEQQEAEDWVEQRLLFIPGNEWPESWIVKPSNKKPFYDRFERELQMSVAEVDDMLDSSARSGKHNELYEAAKNLTLDKVIVASHLIKSAFEAAPEEAQRIINIVRDFLG